MVDVLCFEDLDLFGTELDDPIAEIWQDVAHALRESYRSNVDDPERCVGLDDALSGTLDVNLSRSIESKLTRDKRISSARAEVTSTADRTIRVDLTLVFDAKDLGAAFEVDSLGNVRRITT